MTARINREAVQAELLDLLDRIEAEEERAREAAKKAKERIAALRGQAKERRDILAGKAGVQLPITAAVLEEAREVADRKPGPSGQGVTKVHRTRKKQTRGAESVEDANTRRRGAARAAGVPTYECADPDDEGVIVVRCVECDGRAGEPDQDCPRQDTHATPVDDREGEP